MTPCRAWRQEPTSLHFQGLGGWLKGSLCFSGRTLAWAARGSTQNPERDRQRQAGAALSAIPPGTRVPRRGGQKLCLSWLGVEPEQPQQALLVPRRGRPWAAAVDCFVLPLPSSEQACESHRPHWAPGRRRIPAGRGLYWPSSTARPAAGGPQRAGASPCGGIRSSRRVWTILEGGRLRLSQSQKRRA